jgi:RNA polymerase sigma-70 factor (ECF subfamily)
VSQKNVYIRYKGEDTWRSWRGRYEMKENQLEGSFDNQEILESIVKLYGQPLLRYCHNILCDYAEAQDAVQMTFIKAYNKRKNFKGGTNLSSWLYRIAYTTCIDMIRKKKLLFFIPQEKTKNDDFIREDLKRALLTLSPLERALVFSRVIDEKSYSELETVYKSSATTLRKRYERAKKKLAKVLKETNPYYKRLEERK